MIAEVIFSGTELLLGQIMNINGQYLQKALASLGIDSYHQITVGDNLQRCAEAIRQAADRADLVFIGGGLGPTEDDLSRDALSEALQIPLVHDDTALNIVQRRYLARGITMPEVNLKQALVPLDGKALDNRVGVAPGIALEHQGKIFFMLPGPPFEFNCMLDEQVIPYLRSRFPEELGIIHSRVLKICGIGESFLAQSLGDLFKSLHPTVSTCVKGSFIDLSITAKAGDEIVARRDIAAMENTLRERIGQYIFGADRDTLPGVIGRELARRGKTLAVVEDECSGGLLAHMLSVDPLAAQVFAGGMVIGRRGSGLKGLSESLSRSAEAKDAEQLARTIRQMTGSSTGVALVGPNQQKALESGNTIVRVAIDSGGEILVKDSPLWDNRTEVARRGAETALVNLWHALQKTSWGGERF